MTSTPSSEATLADSIIDPDLLVARDFDYQVRLTFEVHADNPQEAVDAFIERINSNGLRNFIFRVVDRETGDAVYVREDVTMTEDELLTSIADDDNV